MMKKKDRVTLTFSHSETEYTRVVTLAAPYDGAAVLHHVNVNL